METGQVDEISLLLERGYGLDSCHVVAAMAGSLCRVWHVETDHGEMGLKRSYISDPHRYRAITQVIEHLRKDGHRVSELVKSINGEYFYQSEGRLYVLYRWLEGVDGAHVKSGPVSMELLGECLGQIHRSLDTFEMEELPLKQRKPEGSGEVLRHIQELQTVLANRESLTPKDRITLQALEFKAKRLAIGVTRLDAVTENAYKKTQLIHGDFQMGNIICDPATGGIVGLIDMESFHYAPRVWDLGRACAYICQCRLLETREFLKGYHRVCPLTEEEKATWVPIMEDYLIKSLWACHEHVMNKTSNVDTYGTVAAYRAIQANRDEFVMILQE